MDAEFVVVACVVLANVLGAGMIVPQVLRLHRRRSSAGVSAAWVGIGLAMNLWWLAYGTSQELWGMVPVSIGAAVLYGVIIGQLGRLDGADALRSAGRGAVMIAVVPLLFMLVGGWPAAGLAIGLVYSVQFAPAVLAAVRTDDVAGVSTATWVMAFGEALIWFFYGFSEADVALTVGGAGGAAMSGVILWRVAHLSRQVAPAPMRAPAMLRVADRRERVLSGRASAGPRLR